jgi:hypothetical protein
MKKAFLITVLMLVGFAILPAQENPSIIIVNYTGNDIDVVTLKYTISGSEKSYISIMSTVKNGESWTIKLPEPLSKVNRYNIEVKDVNKKIYTKNNVTVSANARYEIGSPPPQGNPEITIVNNTGETINAVSIRYAGTDWIRYAWDNNKGITSGQSFLFEFPNPLNKVNRYDVRLERPNSLGTYTKNTVTVSSGGRVEFTSSDRDEIFYIQLPPQYDAKGDLNGGFAWVKLNGKIGVIDATGKEITPIKYDNISNFVDRYAGVKLNGKWGVIDKTGKEVIPVRYEAVKELVVNGVANVKKNGEWIYASVTGKEYGNVESFTEGLAAVAVGGYWDWDDEFYEGGKWGFIDTTGREVISLKYDDAYSFSEGLAQVKLGGKWGFVDKTGKEAIPLKYDDASTFFIGKAKVKLSGREFYIDKTGKEVSPPSYDDKWKRAMELLN